MTVDRVLGALRDGAALDGEGEFTLDREKARAKMRQFQLPDPRRYVLLLVRAASLLGATRIDVDIDGDDVRVHFDGERLGRADFEDLYGALFNERKHARDDARRELALAINAAMALNPVRVRVESGDERSGTVLVVAADVPDEIVDQVPERVGTLVHVRDRFRPGLLVSFIRAARGTQPEQRILRERCRWSTRPLTLDGTLVSRGMELDGCEAVVPFERELARGFVGFHPSGGTATLRVLQHGVWMADHELPRLPTGMRAIVEADALATDVSRSDVVRDAAYDALLGPLSAAADASLQALARRIGDGESAFSTVEPSHEVPWLVETMRRRLARRGPLGGKKHTPSKLSEALARVPMWRRLDGKVATSEQLAAGESVRFTIKDVDLVPPGQEAVLRLGKTEASDLKLVFPDALDVTADLPALVKREKHRLLWLARPTAPELGEGDWRARARIEVEGIRGEVGLGRGPVAPSLRVIKDGCLLGERKIDVPLPGLVAVIEADFTPDDLFTFAAPDAVLARAVAVMLSATEGLVQQLANELEAQLPVRGSRRVDFLDPNESERKAMLAYLLGLFRRNLHVPVAKQLGLGGELADAAAPRYPELDPTAPNRHPLVDLELFDSIDGWRVSLEHIARVRDDGVWVVPEDHQRLDEAPHMVICADDRTRALLGAAFGEGNIRSWGSQYAEWRARTRHLARPVVPLTMQRIVAIGPLEVEHDKTRGLVGVRPEAVDVRNFDADVRILREGRVLCELPLLCPLPGLVVTFEWPDVPANPAWDGLAEGSEAALRDRVGAAACAVIAHVADPLRDPPGSELERAVLQHLALLANVLEENPEWRSLERAARRRCDALAAMPLFRTVGPKLVSLAQLLEQRRQGAQVGWIDARTSFERPDDPQRIVLRLDEHERVLLEVGLGDHVLEDANAWLAEWDHRREFEARPALPTVALREADAIAQVAIVQGGLEGSIGLGHRNFAESGRLVVCNARRPIAAVDIPGGMPWIGIVSGEAFGNESNYRSLTPREHEHVLELWKAQVPALVRALAEAWPTFVGAHRECAIEWALHFVDDEARRLRGGRMVALERSQVAPLLHLPLFADTSGRPLTLHDLDRARRAEGELRCQPVAEAVTTEALVVALRRSGESVLLARLFEPIVDWSTRARQLAEAQTRRRDAPSPPEQPIDALAVADVEGRGLTGSLWIPVGAPTDACPAFVIEGRVIVQRPISKMFPCEGSVGGEIEPNDDWTDVELTRKQREVLRDAAESLYEQLIDGFAQQHARLEADTAVLARIRPCLFELLRRLHAIVRAGKPWPNDDHRRLYRRLEKLRLFVLPDGRAIDLRVALRERPRALAPLELWDPAAPGAEEAEVEPTPPADAPQPEEPDEPPPPPPVIEPEPSPPSDEPSFEPSSDAEAELATPNLRVLEAVRAELRLIRAANEALLGDAHLDAVTLVERGGANPVVVSERGVALDVEHAFFARALARHASEPILVSFLASAAYTALNAWLEVITDADEAAFHLVHAEHVASAIDRAK